jgi:hypothetical protein
MKNDFSEFVPIAVEDLMPRQANHRKLSSAQIQRIIENFDRCKIEPIKIRRRYEKTFIINGGYLIKVLEEAHENRLQRIRTKGTF